MAQNITIDGTNYNAVQNIDIPKQGSGTARFVDSSDGTLDPDLMANTIAGYSGGIKVTGYLPVKGTGGGTISTKAGTVSIPEGIYTGGGSVSIAAAEQNKIIPGNIKSGVTILGQAGTYTGGATKLFSYDLGTVSSTATSATSLSKSATGTVDLSGYQIVAVEAKRNEGIENGYMHSTFTFFVVNGTTTYTTASGSTRCTAVQVRRATSSTNVRTSTSTTSYGIYANSFSYESNTHKITIPMYVRYNSTNTTTIDGTWTVNVYAWPLITI